MASGSLDFTAAVWQVSTGQMLYKYDFGKPIASLAFHPSGTLLVVSAGHKVFSWQFARLAAPVKILKTRRSLRALHFHPTAPHILLTAEVTERRSGGESAAAAAAVAAATTAAAAAGQWQHGQAYGHQHHHQHQQYQHQPHVAQSQGAARTQQALQGAVGPEPDPQDAVNELSAFILAHNSSMTGPGAFLRHQQQLQQHPQQAQQQRQPDPGHSAPHGGGGARGAQGAAAWPIGLLRNLLTGVTGVFTGGYGSSGGGGGGNQARAAAAPPAAGAFPTAGSFASHGGTPGSAAAALGAGAGGGGAPSVNPVGYGGAAHSSLPGTAGPGGMHAGSGWLNVLAPADVVRHQSLGGGVRHAIPLVGPAAPAPPPPPLAPRVARGGAPSAAGGGGAGGGAAAAGAAAPDSHVAAYDLTWGWDHTLHLSDSEIERVRQLALRAAPELPSAANHDTPCIVTVRLWDFRDPTRELRKELLVLPRVVLCSEMGIHISACGRYMVCCVVRDGPSEACLQWQADQEAAAQAAADAAEAMTRTHAHPQASPRCRGGAAGDGDEDVDDGEVQAQEEEDEEPDEGIAAGCPPGGSRLLGDGASRGGRRRADGAAMMDVVTPGSAGSCRSVEMEDDVGMRPRPGLHHPGSRGGGGAPTVGWPGAAGGGGGDDVDDDGDRYLDLFGDTVTQEARGGRPARRGAASRPYGGGGPYGGDSGGEVAADPRGGDDDVESGPSESAACESTMREQRTVELAARTAVSRPGAAAAEAEYDSAEAAAYRHMAAAVSAISMAAGEAGGDGAEGSHAFGARSGEAGARPGPRAADGSRIMVQHSVAEAKAAAAGPGPSAARQGQQQQQQQQQGTCQAPMTRARARAGPQEEPAAAAGAAAMRRAAGLPKAPARGAVAARKPPLTVQHQPEAPAPQHQEQQEAQDRQHHEAATAAAPGPSSRIAAGAAGAALRETPSTFASIKAHLALQRSREDAAAGEGLAETVAGPEASQVTPVVDATVATHYLARSPIAAAAVAAAEAAAPVATAPPPPAAAQSPALFPAAPHTCYELCIFYVGTSPLGSAAAGPVAPSPPPASAAAPSASASSVAFPAAGGGGGLAGGGHEAAAAAAAPVSPVGPHFGSLLHARPVLAAHCMTSMQLSPCGDHVLVAYGRRHISLCSLVACAGQLAAVHSVVEIYSVPDLVLRRVLLSADDEVNVAVFNSFPAEGMAYGTKEGRLRLIRYDRRPPLRSAIPFVPPPSQLDDELWEAEQQTGASMSVSEGEQEGGGA